jgi:opacity protein-like surface antigen
MISMKSALIQLAAAALTMAWMAGASGQDVTDRAGKWEGHFNILYGDSQNVTGDNGSSADVDSSAGWGFGFGYNFNDHWALEGNFSYRDADYRATVAPGAGNANLPQSISGTMETSTLAFNATYNLLARSFTPFVTGGVGGTYVDTNIPDGLAVPVCWWDPWWGYYCAPVYPTKAETYFSYNVGAGVRWESKGSLFLRALVSEQWIDVGGDIGTPDFLQFRLDIGTRF